MDGTDQRIATIIKEINYWKQHKMLPETYCDFLLTLYTKGEVIEEAPVKHERRRDLLFVIQVFLLVLLVPFSLLVIYSTQFQSVLQLSMLFLFLAYAVWLCIIWKNQQKSYFHAPLIVLLFLVFFISDYFSKLYLMNQWITLAVMLTNFIGWFLISKKFAYKYLKYTSIIGIIITGLYIVL